MSSPILFSGNQTSKLLQNQIVTANGELLANDGPLNLIKGGGFENGQLNGFSLFNTTLDSNLVPNGSITAGATSIDTFTVTSTNPLGGTNSLSVGSSTGFVAGDGFISPVFNIPNKLLASVLANKFFYSVASGASNLNFSGTSSNTWAVYWVDVTNGNKWVQGAGVYNLVGNSFAPPSTGTVQLDSTCTQARLAVICINSSGGAASMLFDDFSVGPQPFSTGPAMSDWTVGTFTLGAVTTAPTLGGTTTQVRRWRRDGDSASYTFETDSTDAGTAGSGTYLWPLPAGQSIDTSKVVTVSSVSSVQKATVLGSGYLNYKSITGGTLPVIVFAYDANNLCIAAGNGGSGNDSGIQYTLVTSSWNQSGTSPGVTYDFKATHVPIAGWSSNTVCSSSTDTRVINFSASSSTTSVGTSPTQLDLSVIRDNTAGLTGGNSYKIQVSGDYEILASATVNASGSNHDSSLDVYVNGSSVATASTTHTYFAQLSVPYSDYFPAGTIISFYANANTGTTDISDSYFLISRKSGPAIVQSSSKIYAKYYMTSNPSVTAGNPFNFDTKVYDNFSAVTTGASWKFVAPRAGLYTLTKSTRDGNAAYASQLFVNGSIYNGSQGQNISYTLTGATIVSNGSVDVYLNSGDYIDVRPDTTVTISADGGSNWISIRSD